MRTTTILDAGPVRPRLRSRRWRVAGLAVVAVIALAGCQTDNTPTAYNDIVENAFTATCVGTVPGPNESTSTTISSPTYCKCAYQQYVALVPYNDDDKANRDGGATFANYAGKTFLDINKELADDANRFNDNSIVPQNVRDALAKCPQGESVAAPGTTVIGPAGTQVPGTAPEPGGTTPVGSAPAA